MSDLNVCLKSNWIIIMIYKHKLHGLLIELLWLKNPASTVCDIYNHWTTISTLLGLISSV